MPPRVRLKRRKTIKGQINNIIDVIFHREELGLFGAIADSILHIINDSLGGDPPELVAKKFIRYNLKWVLEELMKLGLQNNKNYKRHSRHRK